MVKRKRYIFKKRFYIIIILFFCTLFFIIHQNQGESNKTAVIQKSSLLKTYSTNVIFVRNENVYKSNACGRINYLLDDGTRVNKGTKVAEIYKEGYGLNDEQELQQLKQKIYEYQKNNILKSIQNKDLDNINNSVSQINNNISSDIKLKRNENLNKDENQLKQVLEQREDLLKNICQGDGYLNRLYTEENDLKKRVDSYKYDVLSEESGIISYYTDDYENIFTIKNINKLKPEQINDIIDTVQSGKKVNINAYENIYRIVDCNNWYIIVIGNKRNYSFINDQSYKIKFNCLPSSEYTGTVKYITSDKDNVLTAFKMDGDVSPFVSLRKTSVTISKTFNGLVVPLKSIYKKGNTSGVYLTDYKNKIFVPVDIIADNDHDAVIQSRDTLHQILDNLRILVR